MSSSGTLLLVDDEQSFLDMITLPLQAEGYTILQANNGAQALALYAEHQPDLVLLDVSMPGMSGFDVCRRLVADYGDACAPVIFYTAFTSPAEITLGFDIGGADYLAKPCSLNEIRARVRSHVQNHILAKQQKLLAEQLSRASIAKNRFLGMAAHDLRNPLVSIRGFSEFLLDGSLGPMPTRQLALVSIIHGTSVMLLKTVNELLDAATLEAGELELKIDRLNLAELVAKSVAQARIVALRRRVRVQYSPPAELPELKADADKIKQVVDTMLSQSIKQCAPGAIVTARLHASPDGRNCELIVSAGVAPEGTDDAALLRTGDTNNPLVANDEGAALGLAICRNIMHAHHGELAAETAAERGFEFRLTLPCLA